ncbi:MAG: (Fe-S) protein, partial [Candidatus Thiodiazotropha endolucinida]|nr:(Fe-S) protein [Candidatus Thiodiazotropha taylori]MCG8092933.1 (Fe-S) protein [Candidatus Thiodiazotropha endolucinida]MCW4341988.1 (Fe-S) protein [Candidatus Thiodiazotropha endolucinida]
MNAAVMEEKDVTPVADCAHCPHRSDRLRVGRCTPGDVCVRASSGRQIARFFNINPDLAEHYAGDEFWERRAIAARYLSQQRLLQMIDDPDEVVRRVLAYRLPVENLGPLITDPDRDVRITVADRLP